MFPTFRIGTLEMSTYNTVYVLAAVVVGMIAFHRFRRLPVPTERLMQQVALIMLGGLAGTYLVGIIPTLQQLATTGEFQWAGSASFVGTLGGGIAVGVLARRRIPAPLGRAFDLAGAPWALLLALGRIGCLGAGCCFGRPTTSWLGMWLPDPSGHWAIRYPTQIMSGISNLLIFGLLMALDRAGQKRVGNTRGWPFDGFLFLLYIALFSVERFSMEWLRGDRIPLVGPLSWVHLATLAGLAAVIAMIAWRARRNLHPQRTDSQSGPASEGQTTRA